MIYNSNLVPAASGTKLVSGFDVSGRVLMARAEVTLASAMAAGDVLNLFTLPRGGVLVPHLCRVQSAAALGTALTVTVGDDIPVDEQGAVNAAKYSAALDIKSAGGKALTDTAYAAAPEAAPQACAVQATLTAASGVVNGAKVVFWMAYIMP